MMVKTVLPAPALSLVVILLIVKILFSQPSAVLAFRYQPVVVPPDKFQTDLKFQDRNYDGEIEYADLSESDSKSEYEYESNSDNEKGTDLSFKSMSKDERERKKKHKHKERDKDVDFIINDPLVHHRQSGSDKNLKGLLKTLFRSIDINPSGSNSNSNNDASGSATESVGIEAEKMDNDKISESEAAKAKAKNEILHFMRQSKSLPNSHTLLYINLTRELYLRNKEFQSLIHLYHKLSAFQGINWKGEGSPCLKSEQVLKAHDEEKRAQKWLQKHELDDDGAPNPFLQPRQSRHRGMQHFSEHYDRGFRVIVMEKRFWRSYRSLLKNILEDVFTKFDTAAVWVRPKTYEAAENNAGRAFGRDEDKSKVTSKQPPMSRESFAYTHKLVMDNTLKNLLTISTLSFVKKVVAKLQLYNIRLESMCDVTKHLVCNNLNDDQTSSQRPQSESESVTHRHSGDQINDDDILDHLDHQEIIGSNSICRCRDGFTKADNNYLSLSPVKSSNTTATASENLNSSSLPVCTVPRKGDCSRSNLLLSPDLVFLPPALQDVLDEPMCERNAVCLNELVCFSSTASSILVTAGKFKFKFNRPWTWPWLPAVIFLIESLP